ncbi:MAG: calcium-binding protein, partial [Pseudomonadota bacterium]
GGSAADRFVFQGSWGNDVIQDFEYGFDGLDVVGIASSVLIQNTANNVNGDAVISHTNGTITLLGIDESQVISSIFF